MYRNPKKRTYSKRKSVFRLSDYDLHGRYCIMPIEKVEKVVVTTRHKDSLHGRPVCLVGGKLVSDLDAVVLMLRFLGWDDTAFKLATGYPRGRLSFLNKFRKKGVIPVEMLLVLSDAIEDIEESARRIDKEITELACEAFPDYQI